MNSNVQVLDQAQGVMQRNKSSEPNRNRLRANQVANSGPPGRKEAVPRANERLLLKREQNRNSGEKKNIIKDNMMKVILDNTALVKK